MWVRGACRGEGRFPSSMAPAKMNSIASIAGHQSKETAASRPTVFLIIVAATLVLVPQMNKLNERASSVWLKFAPLSPVRWGLFEVILPI